jgi:hypothetical protein
MLTFTVTPGRAPWKWTRRHTAEHERGAIRTNHPEQPAFSILGNQVKLFNPGRREDLSVLQYRSRTG